MSEAPIEIAPCPTELTRVALEIVLREHAPDQWKEIAAQVSSNDAVMIARCGEEICGAAWGQIQPGKTAIYWIPQLTPAADGQVANRLTQAVASALDAAGIDMTQTLLLNRSAPMAAVLESARFSYLAELIYLSGESSSTSNDSGDRGGLEFVPYDDSERGRLVELLERTYVDSKDCAAMNGKRKMDDVLAGYQATGVCRPENWMFVRSDGRDVGVLLMAEDPAAGHCELVYMGVVPEARGQGRGVRIARHALRLARRAGVERVVLAVDAENGPALATYAEAGFIPWDRRTVFVRFRGENAN